MRGIIMAKTVTAETDTSQKNEARRQRKKQARREAKIMLKIERGKKAVQKAQKKLTQAQSNFDEEQTHLHDLEAKLEQIRTTQEPQDTSSEEQQDQAPTSQTLSEDLPELKPEDFQTQEAVDEAYQEPLLMPPASTPPQADAEVIEAFHIESIAPAEGRDDIASEAETDQTQESEQSDAQAVDAQTDTTSPEEQSSTQAEADAPVYLFYEESASPEEITETDTTTPEDTTTEDDSTLEQEETQSLIDHGNEEPELSNNPLAATSEKDKAPAEAIVGASDENKEEDLQA
jgi:hypothetical protein